MSFQILPNVYSWWLWEAKSSVTKRHHSPNCLCLLAFKVFPNAFEESWWLEHTHPLYLTSHRGAMSEHYGLGRHNLKVFTLWQWKGGTGVASSWTDSQNLAARVNTGSQLSGGSGVASSILWYQSSLPPNRTLDFLQFLRTNKETILPFVDYWS